MIIDIEALMQTQANWNKLKEVLYIKSQSIDYQRNDRYAFDSILTIMEEMEKKVENKGIVR